MFVRGFGSRIRVPTNLKVLTLNLLIFCRADWTVSTQPVLISIVVRRHTRASFSYWRPHVRPLNMLNKFLFITMIAQNLRICWWILYLNEGLTAGDAKLRIEETDDRFLALNFEREFSAESALSSASSKSCCTFLYFARFMAAISSWWFCNQKF